MTALYHMYSKPRKSFNIGSGKAKKELSYNNVLAGQTRSQLFRSCTKIPFLQDDSYTVYIYYIVARKGHSLTTYIMKHFLMPDLINFELERKLVISNFQSHCPKQTFSRQWSIYSILLGLFLEQLRLKRLSDFSLKKKNR